MWCVPLSAAYYSNYTKAPVHLTNHAVCLAKRKSFFLPVRYVVETFIVRP